MRREWSDTSRSRGRLSEVLRHRCTPYSRDGAWAALPYTTGSAFTTTTAARSPATTSRSDAARTVAPIFSGPATALYPTYCSVVVKAKGEADSQLALAERE